MIHLPHTAADIDVQTLTTIDLNLLHYNESSSSTFDRLAQLNCEFEDARALFHLNSQLHSSLIRCRTQLSPPPEPIDLDSIDLSCERGKEYLNAKRRKTEDSDDSFEWSQHFESMDPQNESQDFSFWLVPARSNFLLHPAYLDALQSDTSSNKRQHARRQSAIVSKAKMSKSSPSNTASLELTKLQLADQQWREQCLLRQHRCLETLLRAQIDTIQHIQQQVLPLTFLSFL